MVAHTNIQPVANLFQGQESCAVIVRVLRKWSVYKSGYGGPNPFSIEFVFVDKEGTKIEARIEKPYIYKHGHTINEGSVYNVSNFTVILNHGEYRASKHGYKLSLKFNVEIRPVEPVEVPMPSYTFTPSEDCFRPEFNRNFLVDVSGILLGIAQEREFSTPTGKSTRLIVDLDNRGYRYSVTLFGDYAAEIKTFIAAGSQSNVVVVILFAKVTSWPGGTSIQTTMRTSRLLFNPDIPEATALRDTIPQALTVTPLSVTQTTNTGSAQQIFLGMDQKHTLADCRTLVEIFDFVSIATIHSVLTDVDWWYWACRCSRKCSKDDDVPNLYYCPGCNVHVTKVSRKFLLKLLLIDESDSITAVLFDNTARILVGRSAEEVYQTLDQGPDKDILPREVAGLQGKEVLFRIQAEQKEGGRFPRSYRVRNVSEDLQLIKSYREKWSSEVAVGNSQEVLLIEDTPESAAVTAQKIPELMSQDLLGKFDDSVSDSVSLCTASSLVDITKDTDDTPPSKRKSVMDVTSSSKAPMKTIKVEK